jgi:hypothetical protein
MRVAITDPFKDQASSDAFFKQVAFFHQGSGDPASYGSQSDESDVHGLSHVDSFLERVQRIGALGFEPRAGG